MTDYHIHCNYSIDAKQTLDDICQQAIKRGLTDIAITDHIDINYPYDMDFTFDIEARNAAIDEARKAHPNLAIKKGIEIGITSATKKDYVNLLSNYKFDFIIASIHVVDGIDPYYNDFFKGRTKQQAYTRYLEAIYEGMQDFDDYNVLGHMGYLTRFYKGKDKVIQYSDYSEILDKILKRVVEKGKGIEANTKGISVMGETLPSRSILERYYELGGTLITVGSDAHVTERVGDEIQNTIALLKDIGFKYITTYKNLKPIQIAI